MHPFDERAGGPRDAVLDGLRAVAVLAVVLGHAVLFRFSTIESVDARLRQVLADAAMTGVRIFFLISGYVITRLLLAECRERGGIDLAEFYVRRIARIVPPFAVYLAAVLVLSHTGHFYVPPLEIVTAGAFLCNTDIHRCGWFVGHSWSLAVEEQFYLVWPIALTIMTPRRAPAFLAGLASILLAVAVWRGGGAFANEIAFLFIAIGALMAASVDLQRAVVSWITPPVWLAALVAFAIASRAASGPATIVLEPLLLAALVFGAANVGPVAALLKSRPFRIVGGCSYSLYLWQELFLGYPRYYFGPPPPLWALPLAVWLSWRLVERPGIALGRAWTARKAASTKGGRDFPQQDRQAGPSGGEG